MRIEIQSVSDKGNPEKERLILKARNATDIGDYILLQTEFSNEGVAIEAYQTFWFPYKEVEPGDLVVVYTKNGKENEKQLKNGHTAHFFYWDIEKPIWEKDDRAPVLLYAPDWISKDPDEL